MAVYDTPYYGQRRKALTGQGYGPYYGMSLTGGGALPPEGKTALPPEIADKYWTTGTPAITGGAEGIEQPAFTGLAFADDPQATWGSAFYAAGLPFGKPYPGTPQMKGGLLGDAAKGAAKWGFSKATGLSIPDIVWSQLTRNFVDPLLSIAFPNLFHVDISDMPETPNLTPSIYPAYTMDMSFPDIGNVDTTGTFSSAFSADQFGMMDFGMDAPGVGPEGGFGPGVGMEGEGMEGYGGV